jgi:hypothetical protein
MEERGSARIDLLDAALDVLREAWDAGLPRALGDDTWRATPGTSGPTSVWTDKGAGSREAAA